MSSNEPSGGRKSVGVYDRPASADRPRTLKVALVLLALVAAAAVVFFYWLA
jgi:hypothetical protein